MTENPTSSDREGVAPPAPAVVEYRSPTNRRTIPVTDVLKGTISVVACLAMAVFTLACGAHFIISLGDRTWLANMGLSRLIAVVLGSMGTWLSFESAKYYLTPRDRSDNRS